MKIRNNIINFTIAAVFAACMPLLASAQMRIGATQDDTDALYRIGAGDVLEVRVFNRPQLSREAVRVNNGGIISLPMIDEEIQAGCRSESELASEIAQRYLKLLRQPRVEVFVKEFNSNPVAVIGAVDKPGQFQLRRRVRLLELISLAGGPTERAGDRVLVSHGPTGASCLETSQVEDGFASYNLNSMLKGETATNPYALPGDIISIPEAQQAFVVGNVFKPGSVPLKEALTVSQALAMAGGTLPDTRKDRVRILRQSPNTETRTELVVDLNAISQLKANDVQLQPNDIVEVPTSTGKRFLRSLGSVIAPATLSLPMRIVH